MQKDPYSMCHYNLTLPPFFLTTRRVTARRATRSRPTPQLEHTRHTRRTRTSSSSVCSSSCAAEARLCYIGCAQRGGRSRTHEPRASESVAPVRAPCQVPVGHVRLTPLSDATRDATSGARHTHPTHALAPRVTMASLSMSMGSAPGLYESFDQQLHITPTTAELENENLRLKSQVNLLRLRHRSSLNEQRQLESSLKTKE